MDAVRNVSEVSSEWIKFREHDWCGTTGNSLPRLAWNWSTQNGQEEGKLEILGDRIKKLLIITHMHTHYSLQFPR